MRWVNKSGSLLVSREMIRVEACVLLRLSAIREYNWNLANQRQAAKYILESISFDVLDKYGNEGMFAGLVGIVMARGAVLSQV